MPKEKKNYKYSQLQFRNILKNFQNIFLNNNKNQFSGLFVSLNNSELSFRNFFPYIFSKTRIYFLLKLHFFLCITIHKLFRDINITLLIYYSAKPIQLNFNSMQLQIFD